jgi:hypothetical protein
MSYYSQHILRAYGETGCWATPICGSLDVEPTDLISAAEFVSQLGRVTGHALAFDDGVGSGLFCSLCVTKFIAEETGAKGA